MNWQDINISADNTRFQLNGVELFNKKFIEVLKFHAPGLAPVKDETGSYHIDSAGNPLYPERYFRTFGYYCNRASVVLNNFSFHLDEKGERIYTHEFSWTGNFQENHCSVRDIDNNYYHIDLNGNRIYCTNFVYCGDFKDGIACVKTQNGFYKHIDLKGNYLVEKEFLDLGVFHKNFATARDKDGWFHIDKNGTEVYKQRYLAVEPFYNGFALVTRFDNNKIIISEEGNTIISI